MPWQAPVTFQNAENQEPLTWPEASGWHSAPAFPPFSAPPFSVLSGAKGSAGAAALLSAEELCWD